MQQKLQIFNSVVPSKIGLVQSKIVLRGTRHISGGDIGILMNSAEDLLRHEDVVGWTGLTKDLEITRPKTRNPEVIHFGFDPNLPEDKIINAVQEQNEALKEASLEIRKGQLTSLLLELLLVGKKNQRPLD